MSIVYKDFSFVGRPGVDVGAMQCAATDGTSIYVSSGGAQSPHDNVELLKYGLDYTLIASRHTGADGPAVHNQINGIFFHPALNRLFVGANNWPDAAQSWVLEYDTALNFLRYHVLGQDAIEMIVEHNGSWWAVYNDRHVIEQFSYDAATHTFATLAAHPLPGITPDNRTDTALWQAILWLGDVAYLNAHGESQETPWIAAYEWTGSGFALAAAALAPPTDQCTQGISLAPDGVTLLWAERIQSGPSFTGNVVTSTFAEGGTRPLDYFRHARGGFSTRKLYSGYTGSAVKVRRSSDDTEQDIGFDSNGDLDEPALLAFVGSGEGYVAALYNQAGNLHPAIAAANDLTQSTLSRQPRIVSAGSLVRSKGRPACAFDPAASQCLLSRSSPNISQPNIVFAVAESLGATGAKQYVFDGDATEVATATARRNLLALDHAGKNAYWASSWVDSVVYATGMLRHTVLFDGAGSYHRIDGVAQAVGDPGGNTLQFGALGSNHLGDADFFNGAISELLWWRDTPDESARGLIETDQAQYFTPPSAPAWRAIAPYTLWIMPPRAKTWAIPSGRLGASHPMTYPYAVRLPDGLTVLYKQPWENVAYTFDFAGLLGAGRSIASVESITQVIAGRVSASVALTLGASAIDGARVQFTIGAGTDGERYKLTARILDDAGDRHEGEGYLQVVDL